MKKFSYILMLFLFAFFACQTDSVNTDIDTIEQKRAGDINLDTQSFNVIPAKFATNPEAYIQSQLNTTAEGDGVRYGCVTFIDGFAIIDEDCTITSGVPRDYRDCDLVGVRTIACGVNPFNPLCTICAVAYILECDGKLGWVLGYNIICNINPFPFPISFPM